jgi:hypothetical protein
MTPGPLRTLGTLMLVTSLAPFGSAWALPWEAGLGTWSGSLGMDYASDTQSTLLPNTQGSASTNQLFRESLRVANNGLYILDPRLLTGNLGLELGLNQNKSSSEGSNSASQDRLIGYSFDSTLLADKPYTATVFANRNQNQALQPFGGRREGTHESRGAGFRLRQDSVLDEWGIPWFESNLSLRSEHNTSKTTIFGQSLESDETSKTLELNASKGFENSDLGLSYQLNDQGNQAFSQSNFRSKATGLIYSLDFGPTLNRRLDANLNYLSRNGTSPSSTVSSSEHLRIDHSQNLNTEYLYGFTRQDADGSRSTMQNGGLTVAHQLYQNLSTTAGISGSSGTLPNGSTTSYGGHLGQGYHHSLPGKGALSVSWSGSYQLSNNNLSASSISVVDEAHPAPLLFAVEQGFLLDHSFAEANNLQLWNARGGGRTPLTGGGVDYDVRIEGNRIRIVPNVASLLIFPGDPLLASYGYQVDQSLKYSSKSSGFGVGVDYRWLGISFNHQQTTQTPLSGSTSLFLESHSQNNVQVKSQGTMLEMPLNASLDFNNYKSDSTVYKQRRFSSSLIWEVRSNMKMVFGLNASDTHYTLPAEHSSAAHSARTSLDWYTLEGWNNSAIVEWSQYSDSAAPSQSLLRAGANSTRTFAKLSLTAGLNFSKSVRGGISSSDLGFNIGAVRQF